MINDVLRKYIETEILPLYDHFDAAHRRDHADMVISQSIEISRHYDVDEDMVYAIAAFHDTGLVQGRETHHLVSGKIIRENERLRLWFSDEQIETMAQAAEDHRASSKSEPRSIYGKIVAEADRYIETDQIIERTVQYGLEHYPHLDREAQIIRAEGHLREKYGEEGYLKLWFPESPNAARLRALQSLIKDEVMLRAKIGEILSRL